MAQQMEMMPAEIAPAEGAAEVGGGPTIQAQSQLSSPLASPSPSSLTLPSPSSLLLPAPIDPPLYTSRFSRLSVLDHPFDNAKRPPAEPPLPSHRAEPVSLDDPDVRIAAEALGDLKADFAGSSRRATPLGVSEPEPLLTLITTQHPLIGTAINGSVYAYESSKAFSPRFRTSAEFVERNIGNPMVSTVEVMGRRTGVENGMRRWLESRPRSAGSMSAIRDVELGDAFEGRHTKKRKISAEQCVEERLLPSIDDLLLPRPNAHRRAPSQASLSSLPPYDDQTSPSYELVDPSSKEERIPSSESRALQNAGWQQRLVMTTSGLGVAMRTESLERLKYCLGCLRWANHHLDSIIHGLRSALDEWDRRGNRDGEVDTLPTTSANATSPSEQTDAPAAGVGSRIQALSSEVTNTLAKITSIISSYAGAALPDNARQLVTQHLITLPQRYSLASRLNPLAVSAKEGDSEGISIARKMLVLAVEGVDMMAQVSAVMSGTIDRAEEWCQKLGRGGVIRGRRLEDVKEQMEAGEERNGGGEKGKEQELPSKGELH